MRRAKLRIEYFMPQLFERAIKEKPDFIHVKEKNVGGTYHVLSYQLRYRDKEIAWDLKTRLETFTDRVYQYVVSNVSPWQCPSRVVQIVWRGKTHIVSGEAYYVVEVSFGWSPLAYQDTVNDMERFMVGANKLLVMAGARPCVTVGKKDSDTEIVKSSEWLNGPVEDMGFAHLINHYGGARI